MRMPRRAVAGLQSHACRAHTGSRRRVHKPHARESRGTCCPVWARDQFHCADRGSRARDCGHGPGTASGGASDRSLVAGRGHHPLEHQRRGGKIAGQTVKPRPVEQHRESRPLNLTARREERSGAAEPRQADSIRNLTSNHRDPTIKSASNAPVLRQRKTVARHAPARATGLKLEPWPKMLRGEQSRHQGVTRDRRGSRRI